MGLTREEMAVEVLKGLLSDRENVAIISKHKIDTKKGKAAEEIIVEYAVEYADLLAIKLKTLPVKEKIEPKKE